MGGVCLSIEEGVTVGLLEGGMQEGKLLEGVVGGVRQSKRDGLPLGILIVALTMAQAGAMAQAAASDEEVFSQVKKIILRGLRKIYSALFFCQQDGALSNERKWDEIDEAINLVKFDVKDWFLKKYFGFTKGNATDPKAMQRVFEKLFNGTLANVRASENNDYYNMRRKQNLDAINFVEFEVEANLRCGLIIKLGPKQEVILAFYIESYEKMMLVNLPEVFLRIFKWPIADLETRYGKNIAMDMCGCVASIKEDPEGNRWIVFYEPEHYGALNVETMSDVYRIVLSERQFMLLAACVNKQVKKIVDEMLILTDAYNIQLRDIVAFTRAFLRADCKGCIKSGPGHAFICGDQDSLSINAVMHTYLKKKIIANNNGGIDRLLDDISSVFQVVASRLHVEIMHEERVMKSYAGGFPFYVKKYDPSICTSKLRKLMDFDVVDMN